MNAKKITVHAGLSGGGYTWARHGFVAVDRREVELILAKGKQQLTSDQFAIAERIYMVYYSKNPDGRAFPMELWAALEPTVEQWRER